MQMDNQRHEPVEPVEPNEPGPADDAVIGRAFRWSLAVIVVLALGGAGIAYVVLRPPPAPPVKQTVLELPKLRVRPEAEPPTVAFTDVTRAAGIDFVHTNGAYGEKLLPETMGSGCAFFDFDGDGHPDLLLVNSNYWPWRKPAGKPQPTMALYRNDGKGNFIDVTAGSGLDVSFYGMGVAVGDYDNDGKVDVFITAVGVNHLFKNLGNGKFKEVTAEAGVAGVPGQWSTGAAFFDYDNDGRLDLFVCNYVHWSREVDLKQNFQLVGGGRAYGPPTSFEGALCYLYHNDGNGKFSDVSATAGIQVRNPATGVPAGKSLGVAPVDLDGDGWIDLVVSNDTVQNFVFHNRGNGTFQEIGVDSGLAFDTAGKARGAMGIDSARFRNERSDRSLGFAIGNFSTEMTALYVSSERVPLLFSDEAISTGLGPPTRLSLTFGLFFFDYDLDGRLDLMTANGHLEEEIQKVQSSQRYEQPPHLFWNCGPGEKSEFVLVADAKCGADFVRPMVGRGSAFADIDGDGDLDVLITGPGRAPRLLRNDQKLGHHWLRLKLVGKHCNRDAIGAWIEVTRGKEVLRRQVMPTKSYLSQSELPVTIGLGKSGKVDRVRIRWPDGLIQDVRDIAIDRPMTIEQAPYSDSRGQAAR